MGVGWKMVAVRKFEPGFQLEAGWLMKILSSKDSGWDQVA